MEMRRTQTDMGRQRRQIGLRCVVLIQITDDTRDAVVVIHGNILPLRDGRRHPILAVIAAVDTQGENRSWVIPGPAVRL